MSIHFLARLLNQPLQLSCPNWHLQSYDEIIKDIYVHVLIEVLKSDSLICLKTKSGQSFKDKDSINLC